jgi:hypothetical protein
MRAIVPTSTRKNKLSKYFPDSIRRLLSFEGCRQDIPNSYNLKARDRPLGRSLHVFMFD